MELSGEEEEMPLPLNSSYGGGLQAHSRDGHMIHHHHNHDHHPTAPPHIVVPSPSAPQIRANGLINMPTTTTTAALDQDHAVPFKKEAIRYRECLKNHAAAMGGNATDGCGEFMPSGEEGTLEALTCSACKCHRNFHRKEVEGDHHHHQPQLPCICYPNNNNNRPNGGRKPPPILGHHMISTTTSFGPETLGYPTGYLVSPRPTPPPNYMTMSSYHNAGYVPSDSDHDHEQEDGVGGGFVVGFRPPAAPRHQMVKKRFRTKFTPEQKEKMLSFAKKVGWRLQRQEEALVQQFCQEVGVKRRVLKVWMHNNKHNVAKKNSSDSPNDT